MDSGEIIAIVGLGYVGLPLAVAFGRSRKTLGFDLSKAKLANYRQGCDPSGEVDSSAMAAAKNLEFTDNPERLSEAEIIIIVVPTPIDAANRPELEPLRSACRTVGQYMKVGATVIFESTVYPGCTEEVCVPILENHSGMRWKGAEAADAHTLPGFYVGYSPERINPGDRAHRLETITKVVSGDCPVSLQKIANLYEEIVEAGVHRAPTIKVAEAAKVIENTQRDLNIALMNELAIIFNKLEIDTEDVLDAAGTKWNFLPFRPGLVGGHCIGVDPYYLTYKAEMVGHHPQVVLAGRKTNDTMGKYIAEQTIKHLMQRGLASSGARVAILGLTFKENCPDLRNSRVVDVIDELREYCCDVLVHDPLADPREAQDEYGLDLVSWESLSSVQVLILAVPHREYLEKPLNDLLSIMEEGAIVIDVKSALDRDHLRERGVDFWRL